METTGGRDDATADHENNKTPDGEAAVVSLSGKLTADVRYGRDTQKYADDYLLSLSEKC